MRRKWIVSAMLLGALAAVAGGCLPYGNYGNATRSDCGCGTGVEVTPDSVEKAK